MTLTKKIAVVTGAFSLLAPTVFASPISTAAVKPAAKIAADTMKSDKKMAAPKKTKKAAKKSTKKAAKAAKTTKATKTAKPAAKKKSTM